MMWVCIALTAITLATPARAAAQAETASIAGTVTLTTGDVLPGVQVTVWNETIAVERRGWTDSNGVYEQNDLPAQGIYVVRAEMTGFGTVMQKGITLVPNQRETVDLVLRPAASESTVVTGRVPTLEHERSTVQQVVGETLVHSLPLISRDFITLTSLTAGFVGNPNFPSPQGQIYWANNVLVDGASHFSKWRGAARTFNSGYGLEAISEVQVLSSRFSAEYGEALATVTLASTRSGTNDLHGSALFFFQDDVLNSRPAFTSKRPPTGTQRVGATLGGPITADRTHFFGSYEGRRSRLQNPVVSPLAAGVTTPSDQDEHLAFFKIDHKNRDTDLLTLRYNGQRFRWHEEPAGLTLPGNGTFYETDVQTVLASHTTLVSSVTLNQLRVQFARYSDERRDLNPSVYISRAGHSIQGGSIGPAGFGATPEDTLEATNIVSHKRALHAYKLGGGFKWVRSTNASLPYGHGAYLFSGNPATFPQPYLFTQTVVPTGALSTVEPRALSLFGFVQDDWRLSDHLSLNLGLRYDIERISNLRNYNANVDSNNWQPRVGVAWEPIDGRLVVRGGIGLYTQQQLLSVVNRVDLEGADGPAPIKVTPDSPFMPTPPNVLSTSLATLPPRDVVVIDSTFRNPYSLQATAGIEHTVFGVLVSADYVHLRGQDLLSIVDANAPASFNGPGQRSVAQADATRPIRPVPGGVRQILTIGNEGDSWYNALQVKASQSAGPIQTMLTYTLGKAEDQANYILPEDSRNLAAEKARADNDIRHNLAAGFTWHLPGGPAVLSGWTMSGVGVFRSNRPFTQTWGDDSNGTTQYDARPAGRNNLKTEAYANLDLAMVREFRWGGRTVEARIEGFNVITNVNYDQYVGALSSVDFYNQPVTAFPPRRIQLAAVVRF